MSPRETQMAKAAFLVLLALSDRPRHGLAIVDRIEETTKGHVKMGPGTLYGTLQKLVHSGLIRETSDAPDPDDHDARRRYYRLTPRGLRDLRSEAEALRVLIDAAVDQRVLGDL
jgi:DNA-binding PadR family transcriptional regulator